MRKYLEQVSVGDLLWLPRYGDQSPIWLVVGIEAVASVTEEQVLAVDLLHLDECYIQRVGFDALNLDMRIL